MRVEFKIGDRVRSKATGLIGTIVAGPMLNGGDWWVRWSGSVPGRWSPMYCVDLEKVEDK